MPTFIQTVKHNVSVNKVKTNAKYIKGRSLEDVIFLSVAALLVYS